MRILDRYVIKQFLLTFVFSIGALSVIFIIVHVLENLEQFLDKNATFLIIAKFYFNYLPEIVKLLAPVGTLLATLFTVGRLSTSNEIIAMKSGGMSLYRLMLPFVLVALLFSFIQLAFNGWYVPYANKKKHEIEKIYLSKETGSTTVYNLFFRDTPTRNVIFQYYNANTKSASNIAIEDYTNEFHPRLKARIEANLMQWNESQKSWILTNAIVRKFHDKGAEVFSYPSYNVNLNTSNTQIQELQKSEDEMNLDEKWNYIQLMKQGGKNIRMQLIDYYSSVSFPFANLIVILFGVPFASVKRKQGIAIQIGAAMVISFTYMISTKIAQTIGVSTDYDPRIIAWSSNIIFLIAGLITIFKTKT